MPAMVVTIDPDGCLTDVNLGDPDLRLEHLRRLIGCAAVHPILVASDQRIWVADRTDGFSLNVAATNLVMITASIPNQTNYGTIVCTGSSVHGTDITLIPAPVGALPRQPPGWPIDAAFTPFRRQLGQTSMASNTGRATGR